MSKKRGLFLVVCGVVLLSFGYLMIPLSNEFTVSIVTGLIAIVIGAILWFLEKK